MAVAVEDSGFQIKDQIMWITTTRVPKHNHLKSSHEPIVVAQKPTDGTIKQNYKKWGCGYIDAENTRISWGKDGVPNDYVLGEFNRTVFWC